MDGYYTFIIANVWPLIEDDVAASTFIFLHTFTFCALGCSSLYKVRSTKQTIWSCVHTNMH